MIIVETYVLFTAKKAIESCVSRIKVLIDNGGLSEALGICGEGLHMMGLAYRILLMSLTLLLPTVSTWADHVD